MITLPELVALLYQADWKRLSLLARLTWARDREADGQFRLRSETDLQRRTQTVVTRLTGLPDPALFALPSYARDSDWADAFGRPGA